MKILSAVLLSAWFALPSAAGAQEEDAAFLRACRDNVSGERERLSYAVAADCVKRLNSENAALAARAKDEQPEAATEILARNNALVDLRNLARNYSGRPLSYHLIRVLEKKPCPLCSAGLGPTPEAALAFIGREAPDRLAEVSKAAKTWDELGVIRIQRLSSDGWRFNRESWNKQLISERIAALLRWAKKETDLLTTIHSGKPGLGAPDPRLLAVLREELRSEDGYEAKLNALAGPAGTERKRTPARLEHKVREIAAAGRQAGRLKDMTGSEQAAYLGRTFDRSAARSGDIMSGAAKSAGQAKAAAAKLSDKQASRLGGLLLSVDAEGKLGGAMAEAMRGTKAGEEILSFFREKPYEKTGLNRLNFLFTRMADGNYGYWDKAEKALNFNSGLAEDWMNKNKVSPDRLFGNGPDGDSVRRGLARYLCPTFIHEATHQRQHAWAAAHGINYRKLKSRPGTRVAPYQMEDETEAFSMEGAFVSERFLKEGPGYAGELDGADRQNGRLFIEKGTEGIRLSNHRAIYSHLDSLEGSAAKEIEEETRAARELQTLETRYRTARGGMNFEDLLRMKTLRDSLDVRFKWYTMEYEVSAANEAKFNAWRREINDKLYPAGPAPAGAPPKPLL